LFGARILGLYEFAYRIPHLFQQKFVNQIKNVVFPSLSRLQDSDDDLISAYVNVVRFIAMAAFPALVGLFVLAFPTVDILWGNQWHPIVEPLRVLCLPAMISCLVVPVQSLFLCKQRPDLPFKLSLIRLVVTFSAVMVLGQLFGLIGVAFGMVVSSFASLLNIYVAFRLMNKPLRRLVKALLPSSSGALCMGVLVYFSYTSFSLYVPMYISFLFSIVVGAGSYSLIYFIFFDSEIKRVMGVMRLMMNAKT
jgi:PST family polysaccharide transporter